MLASLKRLDRELGQFSWQGIFWKFPYCHHVHVKCGLYLQVLFVKPHTIHCMRLLSAQHSQTLSPAYYLITFLLWPKCQHRGVYFLMRLILPQFCMDKRKAFPWESLIEHSCQWLSLFDILPTNRRCEVKEMVSGQEEQLYLSFLPPSHPVLSRPFEGEWTRVHTFRSLFQLIMKWHSSPSRD